MPEITVQEFADRFKIDYIVASNTIKFLIAMGKAKDVGKRPSVKADGKNGKPSNLYQIPDTVTLNFGG